MRPLSIPATPPPGTYDENAQLDVEVKDPTGSGGKRKRWDGKTKQDVVNELDDLIDTWISEGCELFRGSPVFENDADKRLYEENLALLPAKGRSWGDARRTLLDQVGAYCSYCTSPIFSHLHVEHTLPKSMFSEHAFAWTNFLLACAPCNSTKSNAPNQANYPEAPSGTAEAVAYITNATSTNYLWPSFPWGHVALPSRFPFTHSLRWISFRRKEETYGDQITGKTLRTLVEFFKRGELTIDRGLYYVTFGDRAKHYFGAQITPDPACTADQIAAAQRVIDLAQLNRVVKVSKASKTVDRRVLNRTTAFFRAKVLHQQLTWAYFLDSRNGALLAAAEAQAETTIRQTGFWGVFLTVLGPARILTKTGQDLLQSCFVGTATRQWTV